MIQMQQNHVGASAYLQVNNLVVMKASEGYSDGGYFQNGNESSMENEGNTTLGIVLIAFIFVSVIALLAFLLL